MNLRILVVEDEAILATELESILLDLGCDVVGVAANSKEAVRLAEVSDPDVALVDIHLSDGPTGIAVARQLAQSSNATVVFTTSNPGRIPSDFANAFGALAKPYSERDVRLALKFVASCTREGMDRVIKPATLTLSPTVELTLRARGA